MTASLNSVRRHLANGFNDLFEELETAGVDFDDIPSLVDVRNATATLLCMHDDKVEGDCDSIQFALRWQGDKEANNDES